MVDGVVPVGQPGTIAARTSTKSSMSFSAKTSSSGSFLGHDADVNWRWKNGHGLNTNDLAIAFEPSDYIFDLRVPKVFNNTVATTEHRAHRLVLPQTMSSATSGLNKAQNQGKLQ